MEEKAGKFEDGYTIEELADFTGYSKSFIYDLTCFGCVSKPLRGVERTLYASKGLYPKVALKQLKRYQELKLEGLRKTDIIAIMSSELSRQEAPQCLNTAREKVRKSGAL